ncbi:MAG: DNA-binding protein [Nitrosopumilaceae archaeon]
MSGEDDELERLKAKRLQEMQKNLSYKQMQDEIKSQKEKQRESTPSEREILVKNLGYRGLEVLENAEHQFPKETMMIVAKLAELIRARDIAETIDGGQLLALFRSLGLNVYVKTTISVEQDGKFVSLSEKLKAKSSDPTSPSSDHNQNK